MYDGYKLTDVSGSHAMFLLLKEHGPIARPDIKKQWESSGRTDKFDPSLYPLIWRGVAKKIKDGDNQKFSIAPGKENQEFSSPRKDKGKVKSRKLAKVSQRHVITLDQPKLMNPKDLAQLEMAETHSAAASLANAAVQMRFATMMQRFGASAMMVFLDGLERMNPR